MKNVPDYLVQRVEDMISARKYYSNYYDNGTKPYVYYLIYYDFGNDRYQVCFTTLDSTKSSVLPSGFAGIQFKQPDAAYVFKYDEDVQLYTDRSSNNPNVCTAGETYFYKTNYYDLNGFTNTSISTTAIDYQPYFFILACFLVLIFFALIFKRRR